MQTTLTELLELRRRLERAADALTAVLRQADEAMAQLRGTPFFLKADNLRFAAVELRTELTREASALSQRIEAVPEAENDEYGDALGVAERIPQWEMV